MALKASLKALASPGLARLSTLHSTAALPRSLAALAASTEATGQKPLRVAVVGGGICGPTLAALMSRELCGVLPRPLEVHVFEAASAVDESGAGISLAPNGMRVLSRLGLTERLAGEVGEELTHMLATNPDDSVIMNMPLKAREQYALPMVGFRRFRLREALMETAQAEPGVTVHPRHRLASVECGEAASASSPGRPATLGFEDGTSFTADLVVGCDGLRSRVRAAVRGVDEPPPRYTGNEVVFVVTKGRNADVVPPATAKMVYGPGDHQFGGYGVGRESLWFGVQRRPESRDTWGVISTAAEMDAIKREMLEEYKGWKMPEALVPREAIVMIRVGIYDREPVSNWVRGVVTLAGDAASPIPPHLGQGGNKALEDVATLVACLKRLRGDLPAALALYQRLRIPRSAAILNKSRDGGKLFLLNNPLAIAARNMLLGTMVALMGTLPSGWLWEYDSEKMVREAQL